MLKFFVLLATCLISLYAKAQPESIYDYSFTSMNGETVSLSSFKGKKMILVNTASRCGFTPQFKDLEELYQKFKDKNLIVIGFPCNDFSKQDPGNNDEIKAFCTKNYGVSFIMAQKIHVRGDSIHSIYNWLTTKRKNGAHNSRVVWNFQKYLIDEQGNLKGRVLPWKSPNCRKIKRWLEKD